MEFKFLEIRDRGTCILTLAIQMRAPLALEVPSWKETIGYWYLHQCSGYPEDGSSIMLMLLYNGKATNDPSDWARLGLGRRTMGNAHNYIIDHWEELKEGDVVDVEYILGEETWPKISERLL